MMWIDVWTDMNWKENCLLSDSAAVNTMSIIKASNSPINHTSVALFLVIFPNILLVNGTKTSHVISLAPHLTTAADEKSWNIHRITECMNFTLCFNNFNAFLLDALIKTKHKSDTKYCHICFVFSATYFIYFTKLYNNVGDVFFLNLILHYIWLNSAAFTRPVTTDLLKTKKTFPLPPLWENSEGNLIHFSFSSNVQNPPAK